jgi:hypothetical protein
MQIHQNKIEVTFICCRILKLRIQNYLLLILNYLQHLCANMVQSK